MITKETIVPSTEEPIPVEGASFDDQGLAPEEFPEAGPDPFVAAENTQEDTTGLDPNLKIPDPVPEDQSPLESTDDNYLSLPEPAPIPPEAQTQIKAKETSFYATEELGLVSPEAEARLDESSNQLMTEGRSDLEDEALALAKEEDAESDAMAIESIISDESINPMFRKTVLKSYLTTGLLPLSLKEKYINKIAAPSPTASLSEIVSSNNILEKIRERKNNQHGRVRQEDIKRVGDSYWNSFVQGMGNSVDQISETTGIGETTEAEIKFGIAEGRRIAGLGTGHAILQGLGEIVPQIGGAVAAGVAAPFLGAGALATMGVVFLTGGAGQALKHYSMLGAEGVNSETRMIASLQEGAFFGVETTLPFLKAASFVKSIILNGGATILFTELSIAAQNRILEGYPELQREQGDLTNMTVSGIMGGMMGAMFSRRGLSKANSRTDLDDDVGVPASSVADSQNVGNPKKAADTQAEMLGSQDANGIDITTGGKGPASIAHDNVSVKTYKMHEEGETPLHPDTATSLDEWYARGDAEMEGLADITLWDSSVQNVDVRLKDLESVYNVRQDHGGPKYDRPNSMRDITWQDSRGQDIFTPRGGGVYKTEKGARRELLKVKESIESNNMGDHGVVGVQKKDGGYVITWDWKFDYDPLSVGRLGVDDVKVLGMDMTWLSKTRAGDFIFATGRHLGMEGGAFRAIERKALVANTFQREFNSARKGLKHKVELDTLIRDAEELGKDTFTIMEVSKKFPSLTRKEAENLTVTYAKLRRVVDWQYKFANRQDRNVKASQGYLGVYGAGDGKPMGLATNKIEPKVLSDLAKDNAYVWDYATNKKMKYDKVKFEKEGRTIVKPFERIGGKGESFEFAVLSDNVALNYLPDTTLPKVEGYFPRHTKENFFIDMSPKASFINGKKVTDPDVLYEKLKTTHAAARTWEEAHKIAEQLAKDNPDMIITPRRERMNKVEQIAESMKIHGTMQKEAKRRGERLQSLNAPARLEDRFVSMQKSIDNLAQTEAYAQWDIAVQKSFMDRYGTLLEGEFPASRTEIKSRGIPSKEKDELVKLALRNFDYYAVQKQMKTYGDFKWEGFFHGMADTFEEFGTRFVTKNAKRDIPDLLRRIGNDGNKLTTTPKGIASVLYIHLNVPRQHIIQPAQVREMWIVAPKSAGTSFKKAQAMRFMISTMDEFHNPNMAIVNTLSDNKLSGLASKELLEDFKAIKRSGLLDSLDRNELVRDVFNDSQAMLMESGWQKAGRIGNDTFTKPIALARKAGFDAGEMTNRLGMWYQARSLWELKNPKGNWRTIQNQEEIALEGVRLSGGMSRAGSLPYQRGAASVLFQFMAIGHKLTMNTIQSNATIMTPALRGKLAAARLTAYGFHAGLPAAALLAYTYDLFDNEPLFDDQPELRRVAEHGVLEYSVNKMIQLTYDEKGEGLTDLSISEGLTPYNEHFLPYISTAVEWYKLFDGEQSSNPRFPIVTIAGSVGKTVNNVQALFHIQDMSNPEIVARTFHEVFQLTSGYKNITKAVMMQSIKDIETSNGNLLGLHITTAEAAGKALGFRNNKEIDHWEGVLSIKEQKEVEKDIADNVYKEWVAISKILRDNPNEAALKTQALSSLFSVIDGGKVLDGTAKTRIMEGILTRDMAALKSGRESLLAELYKYNHDEVNGPIKKLAEIVQDSQDPEMKLWFKHWTERDGL